MTSNQHHPMSSVDPEIAAAVSAELQRQQSTLEMIASENSAPVAVLEAPGFVPTNKYAEGYPGRRYYGGCEHVAAGYAADEIARDVGWRQVAGGHRGRADVLRYCENPHQRGDLYASMSAERAGPAASAAPRGHRGHEAASRQGDVVQQLRGRRRGRGHPAVFHRYPALLPLIRRGEA